MTRYVLVLRSGPSASGAEQALDLGQVWLHRGDDVEVALIQDAVLTAIGGTLPVHQQLGSLLHAGGRCVYLEEDLTRRGFEPSDVLVGCEAIDYGGLVDLMLSAECRVVGAF